MSDNDDDDGLICPITHEVFRDPVLAEDGRLYEREAITRWINEHGTSPFTRQVLDVNRLQPDDVVRKKAQCRQRLSVSYNRASNEVRLPPLRISRNIGFNNTVADTRQPRQPTHRSNCLHMWSSRNSTGSSSCQRNRLNFMICICFVCCMIIPTVVFAIVSAIPQSRTSFTTQQYTLSLRLCNRLNYSMFIRFTFCLLP